MGEIIDDVLGRRAEVVNIWERRGKRRNEVLLVDLEEKRRDKDLRRDVRRRWNVMVDEDLTMEERKLRWRML